MNSNLLLYLQKILSKTTSISSSVSSVLQSLPPIATEVSSINNKCSEISGGVTTVEENLGNIDTSLAIVKEGVNGYYPDQFVTVNDNMSSSSFKTIVNASGKGRLFVVLPSCSGEVKVSISIDGVEIIFSDNGPNYNKAGSAIINPNWIMSKESSSYDCILPNTYIYFESLSDVRIASKNDSGTFSKTWFLAESGIPFESSLIIKHKRVSGNYSLTTRVVYTLDD